MSINVLSETPSSEPTIKNRTSVKTNDSPSPTPSPFGPSKTCRIFERCEMRFDLFESVVEGVGISQKMHQKAVSWMMTICWSKNIGQECLWSTLLLFYVYKAKLQVAK